MKTQTKKYLYGVLLLLGVACSASLLSYLVLSNSKDSHSEAKVVRHVGLIKAEVKKIMKPKAVLTITQLEKKLNAQLMVTSGWRSKDHPLELRKGHSNGTHVQGIANDIACGHEWPDCEAIAETAKEMGWTGIITYPRHVHIDTRAIPYYAKGVY